MAASNCDKSVHRPQHFNAVVMEEEEEQRWLFSDIACQTKWIYLSAHFKPIQKELPRARNQPHLQLLNLLGKLPDSAHGRCRFRCRQPTNSPIDQLTMTVKLGIWQRRIAIRCNINCCTIIRYYALSAFVNLRSP